VELALAATTDAEPDHQALLVLLAAAEARSTAVEARREAAAARARALALRRAAASARAGRVIRVAPHSRARTRQGAEARVVALVSARLRKRFPDVSHEVIVRVVAGYHRQFDGRPIRDFVPILVERQARDLLRAIPTQRRSGSGVTKPRKTGTSLARSR
jgi:hypothetical protein